MGYWGYGTMDSDQALDKMAELEEIMTEQIKAEIDEWGEITGNWGSIMAVIEVIAKTPAMGADDIDPLAYFNQGLIRNGDGRMGCRLLAIRIIDRHIDELTHVLQRESGYLDWAIDEGEAIGICEERDFMTQLKLSLIDEANLRVRYENLMEYECAT